MTLDLSGKGRHEMTLPSQRDLEFEKKLMADSRRPRTRPVSYPERRTRDKIEALEQGGLTVFQIMHEEVWQVTFIILSIFAWALWAIWAVKKTNLTFNAVR